MEYGRQVFAYRCSFDACLERECESERGRELRVSCRSAHAHRTQATVLDTKQEVVVKVVWPDADLDPEDAKNESPGQHRKDAFKREM